MKDTDLVNLALRNQQILLWLGDLTRGRLHIDVLKARQVTREYAAWSNIPEDDVKGALDYITDAASLDYLWTRHKADIIAADFLRV